MAEELSAADPSQAPPLQAPPPSHPSLVRAPSLADELQAADPLLASADPSLASIQGLPSSISFPDLPRCSVRWEDLGSPDGIEPPGLRETTSLYAFPTSSSSNLSALLGCGNDLKDSGYNSDNLGQDKNSQNGCNLKQDTRTNIATESSDAKTPVIETLPENCRLEEDTVQTPKTEDIDKDDLDKTPKFEVVDAFQPVRISPGKTSPKEALPNLPKSSNGNPRTPHDEFVEQDVYIDDEPKASASLNSKIDINFNTTAESQKTLLGPNNAYVREDSSPEEVPLSRSPRSPIRSPGRSPRSPVRSARSSLSSSSSGARRSTVTDRGKIVISYF